VRFRKHREGTNYDSGQPAADPQGAQVAMPDMDNGRVRHKGDSLDAHPANARRFVELTQRQGAPVRLM
jgi:hypothetical protein